MLSLTLFLVVGMVLLSNVLSICPSNAKLEHMATIGDVLELCDNGREIRVTKLSDASFFIKVVSCNGNFKKFTLKALRSFVCVDGLEHTVYPPLSSLTDISSFTYDYDEISEFY